LSVINDTSLSNMCTRLIASFGALRDNLQEIEGTM